MNCFGWTNTLLELIVEDLPTSAPQLNMLMSA
jgi:hypothetical protein